MGSRLPAGASRWLSPLARYREYAAIGNGSGLVLLAGGVGLLLLAGGMVAFLPHQTGHVPRALADDCGLVTCTATLPAAVTGTTRPNASPRVQPRSTASTVASSTTPAPSAAERATSGPPAPPVPTRAPASSSAAARAPEVSVTVSYAIDRWYQGIQGQFMIVNHGSAPVTGWELAVALPGDGNFRVWNAQSRVDGDTLIINAPPNAQALAPGAAQQVMIFAEGNNGHPASCTFDGASVCQAQPQSQHYHER